MEKDYSFGNITGVPPTDVVIIGAGKNLLQKQHLTWCNCKSI
jgi:hypothetical protein